MESLEHALMHYSSGLNLHVTPLPVALSEFYCCIPQPATSLLLFTQVATVTGHVAKAFQEQRSIIWVSLAAKVGVV